MNTSFSLGFELVSLQMLIMPFHGFQRARRTQVSDKSRVPGGLLPSRAPKAPARRVPRARSWCWLVPWPLWCGGGTTGATVGAPRVSLFDLAPTYPTSLDLQIYLLHLITSILHAYMCTAILYFVILYSVHAHHFCWAPFVIIVLPSGRRARLRALKESDEPMLEPRVEQGKWMVEAQLVRLTWHDFFHPLGQKINRGSQASKGR